jgi:hypothetical protein
MVDYTFSERRNKAKNKKREKKKHPYKLGGNRRTMLASNLNNNN